jgi:hypothetical protein
MSYQSIDIGLHRALNRQVIHGKGVATIPLSTVSKAGGSVHQPRGQLLGCEPVVHGYTDSIKRVVWKQY